MAAQVGEEVADSAAARRAAPATIVACRPSVCGSASPAAAEVARASAARARPCRVFATESCISRARRARSDSTASATARVEFASDSAWLAVPKREHQVSQGDADDAGADAEARHEEGAGAGSRVVLPGPAHRHQHDQLQAGEDARAAPAVQQARKKWGADRRVREGTRGRRQEQDRAEGQVHGHEAGVREEAGADRSQSLSMGISP